MNYWIFKLSKQELYPDVKGKKYVFDNTHSVHVKAGDIFIYLDKTEGYSFTCTGIIKKIKTRDPSKEEAARTSKVKIVFSAHLSSLMWFKSPLSISTKTGEGNINRAKLGIVDVNLLGWSQSIPRISSEMYDSIIDLVDFQEPREEIEANQDYSIPDTWAKTKIRKYLKVFSREVKARGKNTCAVCGCQLRILLEAAHLIPYAIDKSNRANPGNGICLCRFCHKAMDSRLIGIKSDGRIHISQKISGKEEVSRFHFERLSPSERRSYIENVGEFFLRYAFELFEKAEASR